ncbi:hypothetical protein HPP92_028825 [Vanilla planifolia]|uniref:Uncharacterized protein n=1 Tax=Vanilla planifolia TaxID=51239 RepID=A0A835P722_VANPL|nr:hypothetical protein HPP92_028825 [Vanilla planifolia]KAG0446461.1 hypothetical protein HPP92_028814 [Vanilla planifolia]
MGSLSERAFFDDCVIDSAHAEAIANALSDVSFIKSKFSVTGGSDCKRLFSGKEEAEAQEKKLECCVVVSMGESEL